MKPFGFSSRTLNTERAILTVPLDCDFVGWLRRTAGRLAGFLLLIFRKSNIAQVPHPGRRNAFLNIHGGTTAYNARETIGKYYAIYVKFLKGRCVRVRQRADGEGGGTRNHHQLITTQPLHQLTYAATGPIPQSRGKGQD